MIRNALIFVAAALCFNVRLEYISAQESGKSAKSVVVGELKKADYADVVAIDDALDLGPSWTYSPDEPAKPAARLARGMSISLPTYATSLVFSSDAVGIAGALELTRQTVSGNGRPIDEQRWLLHRYKLSTGQSANPITLYVKPIDAQTRIGPTDPEALSIRSGALLSIGTVGNMAVVKSNDHGRLDVWSLQDRGKHIAAWRPYEEATFGAPTIWATALSQDTVLTLNGDGRLVSWKLPECKAVFERQLGSMISHDCWAGMGVFIYPGLSPNHRHMAVWSGKTLLFIDTKSGKTLGVLGGVDSPGWLQPSFHEDGTKLACTIADNFTQVLLIYDLKTGAELTRMPLPNDAWPRPGTTDSKFGGCTWVDEPYMVVGGKLMINLSEGRPVWRFNAPDLNSMNDPPLFAKSGPDFWFLLNSRTKSLNAVKLPHMDALKYAKQAPNVFAAGPGSKISLDVKFKAPKEVQESLQKALSDRLKSLRMEQAQDQRVTLKFETEIHDTGEQAVVQLRKRGGLSRSGPEERVTIQAIVLRASYLVDGKTVWSHSIDCLPRTNEYWIDEPNKSNQEELLDLQWKRAVQYSNSLFERIPGYVMDPATQAKFPSGPYPVVGADRKAR